MDRAKNYKAITDNPEIARESLEPPAINTIRPTARPKWQWKSNSDPWSKTEEPQWTSYSPEHNYLLEKAYNEKQQGVDLGEYIVFLQNKIQKKKKNITLWRPIRRIDHEEEGYIDTRSERYFETELPKTLNKIFGNLEHFIDFFSRRNPEILNLTNQFQEFERTMNLKGLNKTICPQLISCLQEELLKPIEGQLQDHSLSSFQKKFILRTKKRHEDLISLFQKELESFEELYRLILRAYTMNTHLYLNLNRYLRNKSWTAIDNLLFYVICLCKAFFTFKINANAQEENKLKTLYRGTALDEFALNSYKSEKTPKLFSWNSVTSTSTNREIAENFMYDSADIKNKKYPVLFIIEVPLANESVESKYLKWIDIHQYSAKPTENEVILAPGSAFEVQEISTHEENRTTIHLKLKLEVESLAHEGLIMQGALQTQMMNDNQVKVMCLKGEELIETLENLEGNQLVEEMEFCLCMFDYKSFEKMLLILPTLKSTKRLRFICCQYQVEQVEQLISNLKFKDVKCWNILEVEIIEFYDFYKMFTIMQDADEHWKSLIKLSIDFRNAKFADYKLHGERHLGQLESLILCFNDNEETTDTEVSNLTSQALDHLPQLTSLTLDFSFYDERKEKGEKHFSSSRLIYLSQLNSLALHFNQSHIITGEGITNSIQKNLRQCRELTSLVLDFSHSERLEDQRVGNLADKGLRHLNQLTSLTLNFHKCKRITDEGLINIVDQGLQYLTKLTSLTLDFSNCNSITDDGFGILADEGLKYLTKLVSLNLNFSHCEQIKDDGLWFLASLGLEYLTKLVSLTLDFSSCHGITEKGIGSLADQGLKYLTKLASVTLNFSHCQQIKNDGLLFLASHGLKYLTKLDSLTLNFSNCEQIEKHGIYSLVDGGLVELTELTSLDLNFSNCGKIFSSGVNYLIFKGLRNLTRLISLTLGFSGLSGFSSCSYTPHYPLQFYILRRLTEMKSLTLSFGAGLWKTDESLSLLGDDLQRLTSLTSCTLNFFFCPHLGITALGINELFNKGIKHLTQLDSFNLRFSESKLEKYTSKYFRRSTYLEFQGLGYLTKLTSLTLDFENVNWITNDGIINLTNQGLKYLTKLESLTLKFNGCQRITSEGVNNLINQGLKYLNQLTSLTLDFHHSTSNEIELSNNLTFLVLNHLPKMRILILNGKIQHINNNQKTKENPEENLQNSLFMKFTRRGKSSKLATSSPKNQALAFHSENSKSQTSPNLLKSYGQSEDSLLKIVFAIINETSKDKERLNSDLGNTSSVISSQYFHLSSLALDLAEYSKINDEGVSRLASQGLKYLTQLTSLTLNFSSCLSLTDQAVNHLTSNSLKDFIKLTSLALDFSWCRGITDAGVKNLACQALQYLTKLTSLTLNFSGCFRITDEGINDLAFYGIKCLSELTSLTLRFSDSKITNKGINSLASQGLKDLSKLTSLTLCFSNCYKLTNEGINHLASQGFLISLTSLTLDFSHCTKIRDEGINNLISNGIKHLSQLVLLTLNFVGCSITEFTTCNIIQVLNYFGFLLEENKVFIFHHHSPSQISNSSSSR